MKQFVDTQGRTWSISLNVTTIRRIRDVTGVNLLDCLKNPVIENLKDDVFALVDVLYVACQEQAEKAGVASEEFGRSLGGDVLVSAADAFITELIDFFPAPKREVLGRAMAKIRQAEDLAVQKAQARLEAMTDDEISRLLDKRLNESSTN